jgi:hypothetical protein
MRPVPKGEASDRFDQADQEAGVASTLGRDLDVTA